MKKIVFASALLGILGVFGMIGVGCGGNACEAAADRSVAKLESCGVKVTTTSTSASTSVACTDADAKLAGCQADCIEGADCACVNPDKIMDCTAEKAKSYTDCITACK